MSKNVMVFIIYMFIYLQFSFHSYLLKSELMSSIFSTNMTYGTLLRVHSLFSFLFLFPFMVANFVYIYGQSTGICGAFTNVTAMNLDLWITQDAYIKLAVLAMNIFFASVSRQVRNHYMLLVCKSTILRLYYTFLFGWTVTAAVIFWGYVQPNGFCNNSFGNYMWAQLIINFIFIPIGFLSTIFRGKEQVVIDLSTERGNSPLVSGPRESEMAKVS